MKGSLKRVGVCRATNRRSLFLILKHPQPNLQTLSYSLGDQPGLLTPIGPTPPSTTLSNSNSSVGCTSASRSTQSATATVLGTLTSIHSLSNI